MLMTPEPSFASLMGQGRIKEKPSDGQGFLDFHLTLKEFLVSYPAAASALSPVRQAPAWRQHESSLGHLIS